MHIAIAIIEQMDFVATSNFAHFASPSAKFRVQAAISELGYRLPLLEIRGLVQINFRSTHRIPVLEAWYCTA